MTAQTSRSFRFSSRFRQTAAALLGLALTGTALADTPLATTPTYKFQGRVDYVTTGASFRTQANNGSGTSPACQVSTTATSQAVTGVPAGATIVKALLYWAASADRTDKTATDPGTVINDTTVIFDGQTVTAGAVSRYTDIFPLMSGSTVLGYSGFFGDVADITPYIASLPDPNKTYSMTDLTILSANVGTLSATAPGLASQHCSREQVLGGWGMYIIYESSLDTYKNLVIYEGFDRSQNELTTRTVSGLFVPTTFGAKTSVLAWEGDETLNVNYASGVAESLSFGAGQPPSAITNTFNLGGTGTTPRSGIFNSTISTGGSSGPTAADAGRDDAFGVDFDTFDVTTKTSSGATSGTLNIQGSQDLFYISSVALMIAGGVDDLSLTKTVSNATPIQGSTITYTITLHNDGPDPSAGPGVPTENVEVKDVLPAGVTYVSSSAAAGTYDPATGIWSVLSPIAGEATTLTITATATGAGPITNVAEVISSPQPDSDSKTDNGVTTEDDYASVTVVIPSADLGITKTGKAFVQPGETITYTLTVTNGGPTAASAVAVTDTLPAGVAFVSSVPAPGSVSGQTLSWDFADLAANATQVITVTATTPTTATLASTPAVRSFTNTASVSSATTDPVSSNNSAAASTNTVYGNLIKEVRNVTKGTAFGTSGGGLPGEILEYCVGFENLGGAALPNFVIVDHVPGSTNALTTAYDADEGSAITGFGVKLTRSTLTSYLSSDADTDGGSLTTTGGTFTRGTMTVSLGTLASGESGRTCFQTTIR